MSWLNADGLYLKYGPAKATAQNTGEYKTYGALRVIETKFNLTSLTTTPTILSDVTFYPKNVTTEYVEVTIATATTSTAATLNVGLASTSRTSELDYDAFVKGLVYTNLDAAGEKVTLTVGSSGAGDYIGTTNTSVGYITAHSGTSVYPSGGQVTVRIYYRK